MTDSTKSIDEFMKFVELTSIQILEREGFLLPVAFLILNDTDVIMVDLAQAEKSKWRDMLQESASKFRPKAVVTVCESYMKLFSKEENTTMKDIGVLKGQIKDMPGRFEAIVISLEYPDSAKLVTVAFDKKDGKIILGERKEMSTSDGLKPIGNLTGILSGVN